MIILEGINASAVIMIADFFIYSLASGQIHAATITGLGHLGIVFDADNQFSLNGLLPGIGIIHDIGFYMFSYTFRLMGGLA